MSIAHKKVVFEEGKGEVLRPRFETLSLKFKKSKIKVLAIFYFIRKLI